MKRAISFICYLVYGIYGVLFSCGYVGGYALLAALEEKKGVFWVLIGMALILVLFVVSLRWLYGKLRPEGKVSDSTVFRLSTLVILLVPLFYYLGGDSYPVSNYLKMLVIIFGATLPLLVCIFLLRTKHESCDKC